LSADQAVGAVASLLHQLAPDGDVHAAALALRQVSLDASASVVWCQLESKGQGKILPSFKVQLAVSKAQYRALLGRSEAMLLSYVHSVVPNRVQTQKIKLSIWLLCSSASPDSQPMAFHAVSLSYAPCSRQCVIDAPIVAVPVLERV